MIVWFWIIPVIVFDLHGSLSFCLCPSALQPYWCGGASRGGTSHTPAEGSTGKHLLSWRFFFCELSPHVLTSVLMAVCVSVQITDPFRTSVRVSAHLVHVFVAVSHLWPGHKVSTCKKFCSPWSMRCGIWVAFNVSFGPVRDSFF